MARLRFDFMDGTLGAPLAAASSGDVSVMQFEAPPGFPSISSPDYVVLVIDSEVPGAQEIAHLVDYTAGFAVGSVLRGQEGTGAYEHDTGATWACAPTSEDFATEAGVVFSQQVASARWTIPHDLPRIPAVTVVDTGGTVVTGDVTYADAATVVVTFSAPFSGVAYLS